MLASRPVGRDAATKKYDILSAMMAYALAREKLTQRLVMRLMALITTRYNWQRDELSMGQTEIAKLWSVEPRTVKREMAKMKARNWLVVKRAGARGRVTLYSINFAQILTETQDNWANVGPDLVSRLNEFTGQVDAVPSSNVVPFGQTNIQAPVQDGTLWAQAAGLLYQKNATLFGAWFEKLAEVDVTMGELHLIAPTKFHANYVETHLGASVLFAVQSIDPTVRKLRITHP